MNYPLIRQRYEAFMLLERGLTDNTRAAYLRDADTLQQFLAERGRSFADVEITDLEEFLDAHTENTVKYIIDKKLRWELRDILDQFNINERMIYPGKAGIAKWLARHYFVKRK